MEPIIISIKVAKVENKEVYSYTFARNPPLFKWILALPGFTYNRDRKLLYSEPDEAFADLLEISSGGKLKVSKYKILKNAIEAKRVDDKEGRLINIEIPKFKFDLRVNLHAGKPGLEEVFIIQTDEILKAKQILAPLPEIIYNRKISAFTFPKREELLFKLVKEVRGKMFIAIHQSANLQSLFLKSILWRQSYNLDLQFPEAYLRHLKSENYSLNTIHGYHQSLFLFLYYCKITHRDHLTLTSNEVNNTVLKIATCNRLGNAPFIKW